jgi:hypothetical protein
MSIGLMCGVCWRSRRFVIDLGLFVALMLLVHLLVDFLVALHLILNLALHMLILPTVGTSIRLIATISAHVILSGLLSPIAG